MEIKLSKKEKIMRNIMYHYKAERYWKYRDDVIDPKKKNKLLKIWKLWYIKRADTFNNASTGTHMGFGAKFATHPSLPHGLNGIIISHNSVIGKNCTIYHQVTIGEGRGGAPVIGDDVVLGAGSKVIGHVHIGNHVSIAAGSVIMEDVPDNYVVLPGPLNMREKHAKQTAENSVTDVR